MAGASNRDCLQSVLDELVEKELKRFKAKLNQGRLVDGCQSISRAKLEKADVLDVVELMIASYTSGKAIEVCRAALVAIDQNELAARLDGNY